MTELYHYGILGMKWGIRRYQPYSTAPRKSGKKGKEIGEAKKGKEIGNARKKYKLIGVNKQVVEKEFDQALVDGVKQKGEKLAKEADKLGDAYAKTYENTSFTENDKEDIWKKLHDNFGAGPDDKDFFDMDVEELVSEKLDEKVAKSLSKEKSAFSQLETQYWNDVHSIAAPIIEKYKDRRVNDQGYFQDAEQFVYKVLDTQWQSFIFRHFDDYWINDTESRYNAINRNSKDFTFTEYNRRYGR